LVTGLEDQPYQWSPSLSSMDEACCCSAHGLQTLEQLRHMTCFIIGATEVSLWQPVSGMVAALQLKGTLLMPSTSRNLRYESVSKAQRQSCASVFSCL
jgi:hypothetical protein